MYLLEYGVRLTATDAWSWDAPFDYTVERYKWARGALIIWAGHKVRRHIGYHLYPVRTGPLSRDAFLLPDRV